MFLSFFSFLQPNRLVPIHHMLYFPEVTHHHHSSALVIAHRGANHYAPENTLPAFQKAIELRADMIELDVALSKDGVPMVFHDSKLDNLSNGTGLLSDYTAGELVTLDVGSHFHKDFKGTSIPRLEQVLALCAGKMPLNIEIKPEAFSSGAPACVVENTLDLVFKYSMQHQVLFSSFNYGVIEKVKQLHPAMPAGILYNEFLSGRKSPLELVKKYKADTFHCHHSQLSEKWMESLLREKIPVFVYTVNKKQRMKSLIQKGVKGIFSDKPDVLASIAAELEGEG